MKKEIYNRIGTRESVGLRKLLLLSLMMTLAAMAAEAQIIIGGNVYGGARQADVKGSTFVDIGADYHDVLITAVYGGNDISGNVGSSTTMPVTPVVNTSDTAYVDNTFNAFVRTELSTKKIFIGKLFGGGNGAYDYTSANSPYKGMTIPELAKAYLELQGGTIGYVFGGGNNATVTANTTICIDNKSETVKSFKQGDVELLNDALLTKMELNSVQTNLEGDFQFARVFGGNNFADMNIRPTWFLKKGKIRDLYSGGNEGRMLCQEGLLMEIKADKPDAVPTDDDVLWIGNVYGGCRKSDVRPLYPPGDNNEGKDVANSEIRLSPNPNGIPNGFAARTRVLAGWVNNVYGGNDISGDIYGGNTVGIFTTIHGNVYGGGNGSYAYTDNSKLKAHPLWGDYYYDVNKYMKRAEGTAFTQQESAEVLNLHRPNAEQVSIRIHGTVDKPTYIEGSLYVGGNSATLHELTTIPNRKVEVKIGSYVTVDKVFLGNNGEDMIKSHLNTETKEGGKIDTLSIGVLRTLCSTNKTSDQSKFNSIDLTNDALFAKYMEGCAMTIVPSITFDNTANNDPENYKPYTTSFGSFYCGGNVGSMILSDPETIDFEHEVNIFDKFVGGCNNANVSKVEGINARYEGGFMIPNSTGPTIGATTPIADKLVLNLKGLSIKPMRWVGTRDTDGNYTAYETDTNGRRTYRLEWNTYNLNADNELVEETPPTTIGDTNEDGSNTTSLDLSRRLKGGNIYGGCYTSGHIDGNVVINLDGSILNRQEIFDVVEQNSEKGEAKLYGSDKYKITKRNSGVILDEQGMDPLGKALNVFGGGYGEATEIWGSTTINLKKGYTFQIFGGSERGAIGKGTWNATTGKYEYADTYDARFSTYINLDGATDGVKRGGVGDSPNMAEAEFVYGGAFEGPILGDTKVYLGNGRIFNSFAGSCNADIWGHTETYVGLNSAGQAGYPYVRDHIYGGNDLGGQILRQEDFCGRLSDYMKGADIKAKMHNASHITTAAAYTEYRRGRVESIFGGCYGDYDYTDRLFKDYTEADGTDKADFTKPRLGHAFINFRPDAYSNNSVMRIYGAGQGHSKGIDVDKMQNSSYVLIDIPQENNYANFAKMDVFGTGAFSGMGMAVDSATVAANPDKYSAIIDLFRGNINNVYGGSYEEGFTRRALVNVPSVSTIDVQNLFGGAYGKDPLYPCDVYEAQVNYHSENATVHYNIYGGNNNADRTLYGQVNITVPVWQNKNTGYLATVYGAGYGEDTWSQYTEVNLERGAKVYEVYGGGHNGKVINRRSLLKWKQKDPTLDLSMPGYVECGIEHQTLVHATRLGGKYNTNVHIKEGATVVNYAYGGGRGDSTKVKKGILGSGDVYGTTYIDLLGGKVTKDIYAAGTSGGVRDSLGVTSAGFTFAADFADAAYRGMPVGGFTASSTAYIEGGSARNVYGGGWLGSVGYHLGKVNASTANDIPGETHVIIGKLDGTSFTNGIPAIERNAYGGGEGGAVFGTANLTLNKGYIGYRYFANQADLDKVPEDDTATSLAYIEDGGGFYQEKLHDETWTKGSGTNRLYDSGCLFGGGYIDNSNVDVTNVTMYGGHVRNALFGGGEIAAIGRGIIHAYGEKNSIRELQGIYKAGKTNVELYEGNVHRNVFGGGRGYNNLGEGGTLYSDGYVFGQTEVHIYGGEVGTDEGLAQGFGNVFGGGDIGYVYSAYENASGLCFGKKSGVRYDTPKDDSSIGDEGYYYEYEGGSYALNESGKYELKGGTFKLDGTEKILTEDCRVLIEPHCRVKEAVTINNHEYAVGEYVPTTALNTLQNKNDYDKTTQQGDSLKWAKLEDKGIIIHNAVFAGGNTSSGSASVYANATTVFGNATATIHDVYHRDLITLGTGHTGGLYGDGNLTFVDGYRGLNITNYGTDYYYISKEITIGQYHALPAREAAYYELKYKCIKECTDDDGTTYHPADPDNENSKASTLTADDILTLFKNGSHTQGVIVNGAPSSEYWTENGVLPVYAGRLMNTIQRADFCGVFGSRMVMQGAQDRVPEIVDYTNYTINRVREVSLNKQNSVISTDTGDKAMHGNYFGIYNIVNYLGALTSDYDFGDDAGGTDKRTTDNTGEAYTPVTGQTFYDWKKAHINDRVRNNGNSHNKVALASGVYLELTTEESTGTGLREKDWGYITGVIELDLINVQTGIGGGFVYAKNVHGKREKTNRHEITVASLNANAVSNKQFKYLTTTMYDWQTSGNFVHSTQTIIDDCYNVSGKYQGDDAVPAHYWYIKGSVYVYDQFISAYTGAPNAYSETVDIPLTITAASHGTMTLLNVQPNLYAYWKDQANNVKLATGQKLVINDVTYEKNDSISYWDWSLLSNAEKKLFERDTYVTIAECKIGNQVIPKDTVLLKSEYEALRKIAPAKNIDGVNVPSVYHVEKKEDVAFDFVFRPTNNLSHDEGYILTYKVNNPTEWDIWYTKKDDAQTKQQTKADGYEDGPTYRLISTTDKLLGQRSYNQGNLISKKVYSTYQDVVKNHSSAIPTNDPNAAGYDANLVQATFEEAFILTDEVTTGDRRLAKGYAVSKTEAGGSDFVGKAAPAYICTSTIQLSLTENIYLDTRMTEAERTAYINRFKTGNADTNPEYNPAIAADIEKYVVPAYYCTSAGLYGGDYYESGKNYRGLEAWSSMSEDDRKEFTFNYDALDLFIDPAYGGTQGEKYQYDSSAATKTAAEANPAGYSLTKRIDYTASYHGTSDLDLGTTSVTVKRNGTELSTTKILANDELSRTTFESLLNEQRHYTGIDVKEAGNNVPYYVVKTAFQLGNTPYAVGETISAETYRGMGDTDKANIAILYFPEGNKKYYYCRESYMVTDNGGTTTVTGLTDVTGGEKGTYSTTSTKAVPVGLVISEANYTQLQNNQLYFTIHGIAPTETSTLFVSRNSDIFDLSRGKIITVIYQYDYDETDSKGNVTPVSERHVVNIHIMFKSGIPSVEDIRAPQIILPGSKIGLREPHVTPGAYEVTGGGWELFQNKTDAESHTNGVDFAPVADPLYYYQNGYYAAYYALTYLGRTYSNHVPVTVANYHDLARVMGDKQHHYYIDHQDVDRQPKIYINDYSRLDTPQNGLDLFSDLVKLTNGETVEGHSPLDLTHTSKPMRGGQYLEFILRSNQDHSGSDWTSIAPTDGTACFGGKLHGEGYTISGLTSSLFGRLCGQVYNLGVTGSFTGAGIAETGEGYVENCWINTTGTAAANTRAVFNTPSRTGDNDLVQVVNCYYPAGKGYTGWTDDSHGKATPKSADAFYNGEVAYNLNGFYLNKRYYDQASLTETVKGYKYYRPNADGSVPTNAETGNTVPTSGYYPSSSNANNGYLGYVENRYADGDFVYASGSIPESDNERMFTDEEGDAQYYPIWPDDYLFFGQMLTYGYGNEDNANTEDEARPHQPLPSHINKSGGRLITDLTSTSINRVLRAPAYFQSKQMGVTHYNPYAVFAAKSEDGQNTAYPNMTAIDFTGYQDPAYHVGTRTVGEGDDAKTYFYPPLLDNSGLTRFVNGDLTKNLLVYVPSATETETDAATMTNKAVNRALNEPEYTETHEDYRTVAEQSIAHVYGHPVVMSAPATYMAQKDHLLVDSMDFNAPISYTFATGKRMFYQRKPGTYVDRTKGWEGVSLPFSAELVTTQDKGEITHFYGGSAESDKGTKKGHEYWLRELAAGGTVEGNVYKAMFNYPAAITSSDPKHYTNTFLWDYYYSKNQRQDRNSDLYQEYYSETHDYANYGYSQAARPYIIGFPGQTYYEFDLSGNFKPAIPYAPISKLEGPQVITFASHPGATIAVSDDELAGGEMTENGMTFRPNYLNKAFKAGTATYTLSADGSSYDKVPAAAAEGQPAVADTEVAAFRPYFTGSPTNARTRGIDQIIFSQHDDSIVQKDNDPGKGEVGGGLSIYAKRKKIVVESSLGYTVDVRIVNVAGITLNAFTIEPGETVETRVNVSGVYIVETTDSRYTKKLAVK